MAPLGRRRDGVERQSRSSGASRRRARFFGAVTRRGRPFSSSRPFRKRASPRLRGLTPSVRDSAGFLSAWAAPSDRAAAGPGAGLSSSSEDARPPLGSTATVLPFNSRARVKIHRSCNRTPFRGCLTANQSYPRDYRSAGRRLTSHMRATRVWAPRAADGERPGNRIERRPTAASAHLPSIGDVRSAFGRVLPHTVGLTTRCALCSGHPAPASIGFASPLPGAPRWRALLAW